MGSIPRRPHRRRGNELQLRSHRGTPVDFGTAGTSIMNVSYHESRILASLADSMLDAIVIVDWHGTILFANRAAAGLVGLTTADEGIGMNMLHFIHPDWRSSVIEDLHLIKEGKRGFETDYRLYHLITKQKEKKWVEAIGTIVNYKGDTADLVTMRDVTDRKKAEDLLIRERQAFSIITDASLKELTVPAMVRHILTGLTEIIEFDYGIVRLYNESDDTLHVVSTVGIGDELPADVFPPRFAR